MTRIEKVLSMKTGHSKFDLIFAFCPHDFGVEDDSKRYKNAWECEVPSGCDKCWNREIEGDTNGNCIQKNA